MKENEQEEWEKYALCLFLLYITGFVAGICFVNLMRQNLSYEWKTLGIYLIQESETAFSGKAYVIELLKSRGLSYLVFAIAGITTIGIILVITVILWNGFLLGSLMTMFLTEYGIRGMLLGAACFFPQCLFYVPALGMLYIFSLQNSLTIWKKEKLKPQRNWQYAKRVMLLSTIYLCGIIVEGYVNYFVIDLVKHVF